MNTPTKLLLILIISTLIRFLATAKIRKRFSAIPKGFSLRIVLSGGSTDIPKGSDDDENNPLIDVIRGLNYSYVNCDQQKIGEVTNYTTHAYDGWIGLIQRNEAELMPQFVRPDSTPFEPGVFMTFSALDDSPRIYSLRASSSGVDVVDILYLWANFDVEIWIYFVISLIVCSIVFIFITSSLSVSIPNVVEVFKYFCLSFWNYFMLSVDMAPTTTLPFKPAIILWTSIVLTIFYALHMILMGTLSTDLTVPISTRSIESLRDLLHDPEFSAVDPIIFRGLNMISVLKNSRIGTEERLLYDRLLRNETHFIKEFDTRQSTNAMKVLTKTFEDTASGRVAIIENSAMVTPAVKSMGCYYNATLAGDLKPSRSSFAESMMCGLVSKMAPPSVQTILKYRFMMIGEASLIKGASQAKAKDVLENFGFKMKVEGIVCGEKLEGTFVDDLDLPWVVLDLTPFKRLLRILSLWMVAAFFVLILEGFFGRSKVNKQVMVNKIEMEVRKEEEKVLKRGVKVRSYKGSEKNGKPKAQ